jgi:hypothetical protein
MRDRTDPHARDRGVLLARQDSAVRCLCGKADGCDRRRARLDRRHLPRMAARRRIASDAAVVCDKTLDRKINFTEQNSIGKFV